MCKQNPEEIVVSEELDQEEAAVLSYWTEERMAAAEPEPLPISVPSESIDDAHVSIPQSEGAMSGVSRGPDDETFLPRPKFTTSLVKDMTVSPYRCVGKLFYTRQGRNRVASAYVIGESTIGTAAHCVYRDRNFSTNFLFRARYDRYTDAGQWVMKRRALLKGWMKTEAYQYDMAFIILNRPIRPTTGKLGWMAGVPVDQDPYTQIGYPVRPRPDYPFDGQRMWETEGNYISHTKSNDRPMIIKASGNMTGGSSGGPWAVLRGEHWQVNGVNSHGIKDNPYYMLSPYFGGGFVNLINWMIKNGGD